MVEAGGDLGRGLLLATAGLPAATTSAAAAAAAATYTATAATEINISKVNIFLIVKKLLFFDCTTITKIESNVYGILC